MKPHHCILLFGFSRSTIEIAKELASKEYTCTIIDNDPNLVPKAEAEGLNLKIMDYTDDDLLQNEGIGKNISFVFALFDEDAKNVFLTLSIKSLDPNVNIIAITHTKDAIHKLEIAGVNTILDPYQISGKKIYKLITQPEVMTILDSTVFSCHNISIEQITITRQSPLNGRMIDDIYPIEAYNLLLIGIHDKELEKQFIFISEGHNHHLDAGDIIVVIGENEEIARFKKEFNL